MLEECYEVHTPWGWFRLDAETYKDYLAGKLWINTSPSGTRQQPSKAATPPLPQDISPKAISLRDRAAREGVYPLLYNDLNHETFVYLVTTEEDYREALKLNDRLSDLIPHFRIVRSAAVLSEKVTALENDLDDRVIELCRYVEIKAHGL